MARCHSRVSIRLEHIYFCHCRYFLTIHKSQTAACICLHACIFFCIWVGFPASSNSALYQITNFPSHVLLDKSRRGSRDDNPVQDHSASSWILFRLSLLLLLWYSSKGMKQPSSQSKIVPFGLESSMFSRRLFRKVAGMAKVGL